MFIRVIAACLLSFVVTGAAASEIGRVKKVAGEAAVIRGENRIVARPGLPLERSDTLVTGADGRIGVTFADNSRFALGPNTELHLASFAFSTTTHEGWFVSRVTQGTLSVISGKLAKQSPEAMKIRTPSTILGVRGTEFMVSVQPR